MDENDPNQVADNLARMAVYLRLPLPLAGSGFARDLEEGARTIRSLQKQIADREEK